MLNFKINTVVCTKSRIINSQFSTKSEITNGSFSTKSELVKKKCQESVNFLEKL